jgi:FMN-dependent NADH-azoreductase
MPYTILHINSSPGAERSVSRKLTANVLAELQAKHPDSKVIERDLASDPFPHLTGLTVGAFYTPPNNGMRLSPRPSSCQIGPSTKYWPPMPSSSERQCTTLRFRPL